MLYAFHGPTGRERLRPRKVHQAARAGKVVLLRALLAAQDADALHYLVEIKRGHGPAAPALASLAALAETHNLSDRVWLAASSLEMLAIARNAAPKLRRVLFGAPTGDGKVLHKPTTYILRSLRRHGLTVRPGDGTIQLLCPIGLRPKSVAVHARVAEAVRSRGLEYLPGRVTNRETLLALAKAGHPGAFVYSKIF